MASSMMSSPAVTTVNRGSMVAPFTGLKSMAGFPVWPQIGKKFETLSYLPPLTREQLLKEDGWIPCLEFELEVLCTVRTTDHLDTMMEATNVWVHRLSSGVEGGS
ncbi:hypothetical protein AAZX31_18G165900 [Glycine max]